MAIHEAELSMGKAMREGRLLGYAVVNSTDEFCNEPGEKGWPRVKPLQAAQQQADAVNQVDRPQFPVRVVAVYELPD